ncbi:probable fatty acyl-CoA reductase 4 isoform X1 [Ananas comosus]|uniref:Fatty acyl-CoA reductase n=2 Tax=Ananas comosus TaxID=4615 RepID=A0A6P5GYE8_ANACO|nr:probable fatty acyl-CoA reductase 4 isoform X1 [Ananas comosus]CAD1818075.1 unnamed protein product [Ananas comosus var. bracteatus]
METSRIAGYFKDKNILITGATGFLGTIFVEKLLRVEPNVNKLFLLVRATNVASPKQRIQSEVIGKEIFQVLKDKHGKGFHSFIEEKLIPVAGDVVHENLGIEDSDIKEHLWKKINIIVNVAATTGFFERYDVALDVNVLGAKHVLEFAKKCVNLNMLLHVSTAYVAGENDGLILENQFSMGETLKGNSYLDIEAELNLVKERKRELDFDQSTDNIEKKTMKELGLTRARNFGWPNTYVFTKAMGEMLLGHLREDLPLVIIRPSIITSIYKEPLPGWMEGTRTIDTFIIGYAKGKLTCFLGDPNSTMDVIPGDMVVNAMISTIVAHSSQQDEFIYHVGSSMRNPASYSILEQCGYEYFLENPRIGKDGKPTKTKRLPIFRTLGSFQGYMTLRYKLPLEVLHMLNLIFCGLFAQRYNELSRMYKFIMHLVDLYAPYAFFKGCFDDTNLERLRVQMMKDKIEAQRFDFDPKSIDWKEYFYNIHIPGVLKYLQK